MVWFINSSIVRFLKNSTLTAENSQKTFFFIGNKHNGNTSYNNYRSSDTISKKILPDVHETSSLFAGKGQSVSIARILQNLQNFRQKTAAKRRKPPQQLTREKRLKKKEKVGHPTFVLSNHRGNIRERITSIPYTSR